MSHADQATVDLLNDYFAAMEAKDFDRLGSYYADNIPRPSPTPPLSPAGTPCWPRWATCSARSNRCPTR
ncbi:hypothetical protein GCM10022236_27620 [Microlunatus ginsengisoli]|uniref:SnoaL-like domain-containing protein n=1 Tax=Microlunatus ginsengisoli TaxID=363863 RepID=A0ABP7A2L6_9ACTN